jgi:hypothetical protein
MWTGRSSAKKVHRLLDHSLDAERQGDESAFSPLL